jgi:Fibrobacter succinogenes major domain (Fib_succ_major).
MLKIGAYAVYADDLSIATVYGNLYNGFAVNDARGFAPEG